MKWFRSKYAYPIIVFSLFISITLQGAWLHELFISQKQQLKKDIEQAVSTAAIQTMYNSLNIDLRPGKRFREFFLSDQWLQMRQAFDNIRINGVHSNFKYGLNEDSSYVDMRIAFSNKASNVKEPAINQITNKESGATLRKIEKQSIVKMDSAVKEQLAQIGVMRKTAYALYDYGLDTLVYRSIPERTFNKTDFHTSLYSYNLKHLHKYQLIIDELNTIVVYKMRYYILSSLLMIVLTATVFYFLLRLIRDQQVYANAKIAFTNNMTHEFKTPVATIAVALESITKYQLFNEPDKLRNYLDISCHELQRLDLMIEKVLNLSEENETFHSLRRELYDVRAGLTQVISSMQVQLGDNNATIHLKPSEEPCFILGDPMHLTNVFYNLIDNAIKYAGPELALKISYYQTSGHITLHFRDNGPGIERVFQKKIFTRFFRIPDQGDTHNVKGSGLGLHYVKEVIEHHGGSITIKSEPQKGSDFIIILPAEV